MPLLVAAAAAAAMVAGAVVAAGNANCVAVTAVVGGVVCLRVPAGFGGCGGTCGVFCGGRCEAFALGDSSVELKMASAVSGDFIDGVGPFITTGACCDAPRPPALPPLLSSDTVLFSCVFSLSDGASSAADARAAALLPAPPPTLRASPARGVAASSPASSRSSNVWLCTMADGGTLGCGAGHDLGGADPAVLPSLVIVVLLLLLLPS